MQPRQFARIAGSILVLIGILALIPSFSTYPTDLPVLNVNDSYGVFANMIPMNILNKLLLIVLGVWGIAASMNSTRGLPMSINWSRIVGGIAVLGTVFGLIPSSATLWGNMPLFGGDIVFHAVLAIVATYYGYALRTKADHKVAPLLNKGGEFTDRRKVG